MDFNNISPRADGSSTERKKSSKKEVIDTSTQVRVLKDALDSTIQRLGAVYRFIKKNEEILDTNPKINRRDLVQKGILIASAAVGVGIKKSLESNDSEVQTASKENNNAEAEFSPEEERWLDAVAEKYEFSGWEVDLEIGGLAFVRPPSDVEPGYYDEVELNNKEEQAKIEILQDIFIKQWEDDGKININAEVKEKIKMYWKIAHQKEGARRSDLVGALKNLKPWHTEIKEEFNKVSQRTGVDIPEKLVYLAIPESYCRNRAVSSASAVGFFQLMAATARGDNRTADGLVVNENIDERLDVPENARRAAEYLVWLYKQAESMNSSPEETWRLVLAGYNGAYFKDFKQEIQNEDGFKKYNLYLTYRENNLNKYLKTVLGQGYFENYKVRRGETLEGIANKCKVNLKELQQLNNKPTIFVQKGEKLKIPVFKEEFEYKIQPGDDLWRIAKVYDLERDDIVNIPENANKIGDNYFIKAGDTLKIRITDEDGAKKRKSLETIFKIDLSSALENLNYPEKFFAIYEILEEEKLLIEEEDDTVNWERVSGNGWTLKEISKKVKISLKSLGAINPHIKNINVRIPKNVDINIIPKSIADKLLEALKIQKIRVTKIKKKRRQ